MLNRRDHSWLGWDDCPTSVAHRGKLSSWWECEKLTSKKCWKVVGNQVSSLSHPANHPESNKEQRKWSCFHLQPDGKKCIQKCELMKKAGFGECKCQYLYYFCEAWFLNALFIFLSHEYLEKWASLDGWSYDEDLTAVRSQSRLVI